MREDVIEGIMRRGAAALSSLSTEEAYVYAVASAECDFVSGGLTAYLHGSNRADFRRLIQSVQAIGNRAAAEELVKVLEWCESHGVFDSKKVIDINTGPSCLSEIERMFQEGDIGLSIDSYVSSVLM